MINLLEQITHAIDSFIPDKDELTHGHYPKIEHLLLILRNAIVIMAVIFFVLSLFFKESSHNLKAAAYFCGAAAYCFEYLLLTDCFREKVPHNEMFMAYCFGPLYLLLGLSYIF
ncbi:MAG: hypothetical protein IJO86_03375 [Oscillospiraceae bacterium]|nr:hypothetical protein [Oscillospiraceae bacterium]